MDLEVDPSPVKPSDEIAALGNSLIANFQEECTLQESWTDGEWVSITAFTTDSETTSSLTEIPLTQHI